MKESHSRLNSFLSSFILPPSSLLLRGWRARIRGGNTCLQINVEENLEMRISVCVMAILGLLVISAGCKSETSQTATNAQQTTNTQVTTTTSANVSSANIQTPPSSNTNTTSAAAVPPAAQKDACSLITSEEIQSVQGEAVKETKQSESAEGGLLMKQCFYTTPTFSKSVNVTLTESDPKATTRRDPKEFWEKSFGEYDKDEKERERDKKKESEREKEKGKEKERGARTEEEEEGAPPQKVAGLGDEAFWTSSRVGGALYVLKGNSFIRVSLGGSAKDESTRLNRAKALAEKALKRL
jgi:type IV secretory pathway VirB10-like protein